ncbi:MAG: hypothetical protein KGJ07_06045, partial [Patescibacteria group bacterium]|nr:hypothetical protein [Patescibacteria group bacterium]
MIQRILEARYLPFQNVRYHIADRRTRRSEARINLEATTFYHQLMQQTPKYIGEFLDSMPMLHKSDLGNITPAKSKEVHRWAKRHDMPKELVDTPFCEIGLTPEDVGSLSPRVREMIMGGLHGKVEYVNGRFIGDYSGVQYVDFPTVLNAMQLERDEVRFHDDLQNLVVQTDEVVRDSSVLPDWLIPKEPTRVVQFYPGELITTEPLSLTDAEGEYIGKHDGEHYVGVRISDFRQGQLGRMELIFNPYRLPGRSREELLAKAVTLVIHERMGHQSHAEEVGLDNFFYPYSASVVPQEEVTDAMNSHERFFRYRNAMLQSEASPDKSEDKGGFFTKRLIEETIAKLTEVVVLRELIKSSKYSARMRNEFEKQLIDTLSTR